MTNNISVKADTSQANTVPQTSMVTARLSYFLTISPGIYPRPGDIKESEASLPVLMKLRGTVPWEKCWYSIDNRLNSESFFTFYNLYKL